MTKLTYAFLPVLLAFSLPAFAQQAPEPDKKIAPQLQKLYERRQADMVKMDTNKDGILQPEELKASTGDRFDAADTNKDGKISEEEAQQMVKTFELENQQLYGSFTERKGRELDQRLTKIDADEDGVITQAEYEAYYSERYKKLDEDGDGKLNIKEYETDVEEKRRRRDRD